MAGTLLFNVFIDCEATQPAVDDVSLGERSARGFADVLEAHELRGTFHVIPTDLEASSKLYRDLESRGHEVGLHVHPILDGLGEFFGVNSGETQHALLERLCVRFAQVMGHPPTTWCPGYVSTNDATYRAAFDAGFRHGCTSLPGRALPECASVHMGAPLDPHYAHEHNRLLPGQMDYVELPPTVDPDSRMWGGKHPQDLRVELVDAKNHWYTIKKSVERQVRDNTPLRYLRAFTHNTFDYTDPRDFRRQTLEGIIARVHRAAEEHELTLRGATAEQMAAAYRSAVPRHAKRELVLDRSGY